MKFEYLDKWKQKVLIIFDSRLLVIINIDITQLWYYGLYTHKFYIYIGSYVPYVGEYFPADGLFPGILD